MALFKRGAIWWMRFSYQGQQIRRSTESSDRKIAQKILDKVKGEIAEGKWFKRLPGEERTFKEMMEKYSVEHVSQKASARQYRGYIKNLNAFFGDLRVSEITPSLINEYKMKRRNDGVGPASINREMAVLKNAFNKAIKEWEWVRENPVQKVSMEKEPKGRVRYLSPEEFQTLYDACADWLKPIVLVAYHTGMRRENTLSLRWDQVDLFRRLITLEHTKNGERLSIPLNETMMELFKTLSKVRHIRSPYVFCHRNGRRFVEIKTAFGEALKKAKIENFRFNDLRHCFASSLVQRNISLYEVQKLLGHKDGKMTQRYAHLAPENLRNAVLVLDENGSQKEISTNLAQSKVGGVSQG